MKSIEPVHSRRIAVQPQELTIGQIVELCTIPYVYEQRTITAFLNFCCKHLDRPKGHAAVTDPLMWSVNERMNVVIYYMSAILEDGPDFQLGNGHLHDYLLAGTDYVESVEFMHRGMTMLCTPLHGYQAEAIEALVLTGALPKQYISWQWGVMAACIRGVDEPDLEYVDPTSYKTALLARIQQLKGAPDTDFIDLFDGYSRASQQLQHFVHAVFNANGVQAAQVTEPDAETGVPSLGLARFHPRRAISRRALELVESDDEHQS